MIDVWAPGDKIQSAWPNPSTIYAASGYNGIGYPDTKYGGDNWRYTIGGTSMASPQVCGIAALLATGKERLTNSDVLGFIQQKSYENDMTFDINGGLFDDRTAAGGGNPLHGGSTSTSKEIRAINPRNVSGIINGWYKETLKGHRRPSHSFNNAQMYPRTNTFYRALSEELNKTFPISVTASGGLYVFNGDDRLASHSDATNTDIVVKKGDTIQFNVNAISHPFWISNRIGTGVPSIAQIPSGISGNGSEVATIVWDTSTVATGTYYYNCENHSTMYGIISVNA